MGIPNSTRPLFLAAAGQAAGGAGYEIERSVRFNSSDSAYCGRTFSSVGTRTTWTFSLWVKRVALGATTPIFGVDQASTQQRFFFTSTNTLGFGYQQGESYVETTAVFRDT